MTIMKIYAEHLETGERRVFYMDNVTYKVYDEPVVPFSPSKPPEVFGYNEGTPLTRVKIQLGLNCNYSCTYCQQGDTTAPRNATPKDVEKFIEKFMVLPLNPDNLTIAIWGGEPFVYWKTMKPLVEGLKARIPYAKFSVITNGSLFTKEMVDWMVDMDFSVGVSHDGPGQHLRNDDPLESNYEAIKYAIEKLLPLNRFSFNTMLNKHNQSRYAAIQYFKEKFPGWIIPLGETGFIKASTQSAQNVIDMSLKEHFEMRRNLWSELRFVPEVRECCNYTNNNIELVTQIADTPPEAFDAGYLNTPRCGLGQQSQLAIDIDGNIILCHETTAKAKDSVGTSYCIGHLNDLKSAEFSRLLPWNIRNHCSNCPVLPMCRGGCMLLEGDPWDATCDVDYSDRITLFAIGFEQLTGYVPIIVDSPGLPDHMKDIWGTLIK